MQEFFNVPDGIVYFNAAHMGLLPRAARDAGRQAIDIRAAPWSASGAEDMAERLRGRFGLLIGSPAHDIALAPSTSYIMAAATATIPLNGRTFLHLEDEHPSGILPWLRHAMRTSAPVRCVPRPADGDWTAAVLARIDVDVGIACLPHCHWLDGSTLDLVAIGAALRAVGADLIVDATQSAGARTIDVAAIRPALIAASGYKWLLGPMGVAYAYVAPGHQHAAPIEDGFTQRDGSRGWFDSERHVDHALPWKPGARRFDAGGMYDPIKLAMALAGLDVVDTLSVAAIERTLLDRSAWLVDAHPSLGILSAHRPGHILSFRPAAIDDAMQTLERHGIVISRRGPYVRISGHVWNDDGDHSRLSGALAAITA